MANRTALFSRVQPGGVYTISDIEQHPGDVWFVCSTTGSDSAGYGQSPDTPTATLDYAIGLATASQGDVIYVLPGHNETITAGTSCVIDKIGLSIIGLGRGANRPTFDFDNTAGSIEMDAASCRLSNVILRASVSATVVAINVDAHYCEIDNCLFTYEDTGDEFITCVDINAFDFTHVHDCVFDTETGSAQATEAIHLIDTNDVTIERNVFRGTWSDAAIFCETTLSARLVIKDNVIYNSDTSVYAGIDGGALNTTGMVIGNNITSLYATTVAKVVRLGNLTFHGNTYANAVDERAALLVPTTSAA